MISVFMYHDIRDSEKYLKRYELKSYLGTQDFIKHLSFLKKNYTIIRTSQIENHLQDTDEKFAILTFDDGLKDHVNIIDILLDNNVFGSFFIPTLPITQRKMILSHKIQFILAADDEKNIVNKILKNVVNPVDVYNKYRKSKFIDNWWSEEMVFITNFLRYNDHNSEITNKLFNEIVTNDERQFCEQFYLSENDIKQIVNCGMEVGGHGYTSDILTQTVQSFEILESDKFISNFYGGEKIFSYPNGIFNEETIKILKTRNYKYAFTTEETSIQGQIDQLKLPRIKVHK